jgi:3-oxoadipate enol-lactonase/4-carboxymuconolactone decarboxylase
LLQALQDTERFSYSWVCEALASFDVRDRLSEITVPVLAVAGSDDVVTPPEYAREIASGVLDGRVAVVDGVAHLAPVENPAEIAVLISEIIEMADPAMDYDAPVGPRTLDQVLDDGMRVRREVLGDAHVDRAIVSATEFTADFQEFITTYAWGSIWTRPGLDRRSRSMITLTALVALGHHEELALHVRAARTNGLTDNEIKEVLLQSAIYCGVPAANTAFRIAQDVLNRMDAEASD